MHANAHHKRGLVEEKSDQDVVANLLWQTDSHATLLDTGNGHRSLHETSNTNTSDETSRDTVHQLLMGVLANTQPDTTSNPTASHGDGHGRRRGNITETDGVQVEPARLPGGRHIFDMDRDVQQSKDHHHSSEDHRGLRKLTLASQKSADLGPKNEVIMVRPESRASLAAADPALWRDLIVSAAARGVGKTRSWLMTK